MANDISFRGIKEFCTDVERIKGKVRLEVAELVETTGHKIEEAAKDNLTKNKSVKSGELRRSIRTEFNKNMNDPISVIGTRLFYAPYVEYGTRRANAKPYFTPAVSEWEKKFYKAMKEVFKI